MYIDTSNIEEIRSLLQTGLITGVTTNPTILLKANQIRLTQIRNILDLKVGEVFVQVVGDSFEELKSDFKKLYTYFTNEICYKIAVNIEGLKLINYIKRREPSIKILATAIYSADQGIAATIVNADYLAPYVNRMIKSDIDPYEEISKMRQFIDDNNSQTKILSASFKTTQQITEALMAGSHYFTAPFDLIVNWVNKDIAQQAINKFNEDGKQNELIE